MPDTTVYLISGANRGIGFSLTSALAERPNTIIFAGTRNPAESNALNALAAKQPEVVHVVKLTSGSVEDNKAAVAEIEKEAGQLDVLIANAGISKYYGPVSTTPINEFMEHYKVNTLGPTVLFQAAHELLLKSRYKAPIFAVISSAAGSIGRYRSMEASAYGSSKAAMNFLIKAIHDEHSKEGLISIAISPGWVATDMGNRGAIANGMTQAPITLEASINGILSRLDGATREKTGGKFWNAVPSSNGNAWDIDLDEVPW